MRSTEYHMTFRLNFFKFLKMQMCQTGKKQPIKISTLFLIVTKLNGISVWLIPKSFSRVCVLQLWLNSGYFRQICRLHEWAIKNKEKKNHQIWKTILFFLTSNRQITSGHRRTKNIPGSTCVLPSITVIQISNDQLSFFNQILCT